MNAPHDNIDRQGLRAGRLPQRRVRSAGALPVDHPLDTALANADAADAAVTAQVVRRTDSKTAYHDANEVSHDET